MAHVPRCLVDDLAPCVQALPAEARRHLRTVLRLRPGDALLLHDGRGGLARAELLDGDRVRITRRDPDLPPAPPLVLAVALPRLPRLEWLVEKAAELEVTRLVLLHARHAERDVGDGRLARLNRLADEALLQCGRRWRLVIEGPCQLPEVLAGRGALQPWLATPDPGAGCAPDDASPGGVLALIGPEGGFAPDELALLRDSGARPVRLGRTILRVETAALALAVLARDRLGAAR
jgi:16S rRNA (uracil1498-N3)-methyltransferase